MNKLITFCAAISLTAMVYAQAPQKMSYQAVVRNASDQLVVASTIGMRITILQGDVNGTTVYEETQAPVSNQNGLVSIEIGGGTVVNGSFEDIDWANGPFFVKTETDPTGGTNYSITATSQLLSVPYALHAGTVSQEHQNISDVLQQDYDANGQYLMNLNKVGIGVWDPSSTTASLSINPGVGQQGLDLSTYDGYANMRVLYNSNSSIDKDMYFGMLSGDTSSLHLYTDNVETMTLQNKRIGIGMNNPTTAKLVINAGSAQQGLDLSTFDSYANMRVIHNSNNAFDNDMYFGYLSGDTSSLHLYSDNVETMTIKNQRIGIGTSSPLERLEINGNLNTYGTYKFYGTNVIFGNTNDVYGNFRVLQNNSATQQDGMYINFNSTGSATAHLRFYANGSTERMFIDAATGYVGIGTTTPTRTLHVNAVMKLEPTSAPANPTQGDMYMDGGTHKLMVFDGTTWQACW